MSLQDITGARKKWGKKEAGVMRGRGGKHR